MTHKYYYPLLDFRVIDGDSLIATLDLGFNLSYKDRLRLAGLDAPKIRTKNLEEKERGVHCRNWLQEQLQQAQEVTFHCTAENDQFRFRGKYGRLLGVLYADGLNLNAEMLNLGLAIPWEE